jgi:O-methyltransferase
MPLTGGSGGPWTAETHNTLYPGNLNRGLVEFIARYIQPKNFMELGGGVAALANAVANTCALTDSYTIEPLVSVPVATERNLRMLNLNILADAPPPELNRKFDLVMSIEVAEHIDRAKHELVFDFLAARAGRWVVFSGARPGQGGGHGHVAERPEAEWREEFVSRGFAFDPRMTLRVRTLCDTKNVNHRLNVQVFHAPEDKHGLDGIEEQAKPHLGKLLDIVNASGGELARNPFYVDRTDAMGGMPAFSLRRQRQNMVRLAKAASSALVLGFDAGHAALLFLLANPRARVVCLDTMASSHSQACFDYLTGVFGQRLSLVVGEPATGLAQLHTDKLDLAYVDAAALPTVATALRAALNDDHVLVIDGAETAVIAAHPSSMIEVSPFATDNVPLPAERRKHALARSVAGPAELVDGTLAKMAAIYTGCAQPSVYLVRGPDGKSLGRARAEGLIAAVRSVEAAGLTGAFVEVGVGAGHSAVIAALASSRFIPRDFYLFDTFCGFLDLPDEKDAQGNSIRSYDLSRYRTTDCEPRAVCTRLHEAGVPDDRVFAVEGKAEDRVPVYAPERIAILRIDANLHHPTLAALETMYDRLEKGGWLILGDYGHWKGCQEAVDGFFAKRGTSLVATAVDKACFMHQK